METGWAAQDGRINGAFPPERGEVGGGEVAIAEVSNERIRPGLIIRWKIDQPPTEIRQEHGRVFRIAPLRRTVHPEAHRYPRSRTLPRLQVSLCSELFIRGGHGCPRHAQFGGEGPR